VFAGKKVDAIEHEKINDVYRERRCANRYLIGAGKAATEPRPSDVANFCTEDD
jgi:hypothetical protein